VPGNETRREATDDSGNSQLTETASAR